MYPAQEAAQEDPPQSRTSKRKGAKGPFSSFSRSLSSFQYQADDEMKAIQRELGEAHLHVEPVHEMFSSSSTSKWKVSNFLSTGDSDDEWIP